ncbi:MAG TPA: SCO family protein [Vicinamibacterales bacterium]|nr:SCO family protein [Vicinamibacterales bacterium]
MFAGGCGPREPQQTYTLNGQVLTIEAPRKQLTIKHDEIKGLMPAMTMPYSVRDEKLLASVAPGDLVNATLVIVSNDAYLSTITKVGHADVPPPPPDAPMPAASSGFELLKPGDAVPDTVFVDQDGNRRRFDGFKGSVVVMTFIYTRCPLPTFCPLMDRHFASMQKPLREDAALKSVHLVTVSFDPETDTPPVLRKHAKELNADLSRWTFLTGDRDEVDRFAARFGLSVSRAMNDPRDVTHNLRTVIIDKDGRLVKSYTGNDWTPAQVLADVRGGIRD